MSLSPVQFAREFEQLKTRLTANVSDDTKLLRLSEFCRKHSEALVKMQFETYRLEIRQFAESFISESCIKDLPFESLFKLLSLTDSLGLKEHSEIVTYRIAQIHCYVGEFGEAVKVLARRRGLDSWEPPDGSEPLRDREGLEIFCQRLRGNDDWVCDHLEKILADWTRTAEELRHDQTFCLFVDLNGSSDGPVGRLKVLRGNVELSPKTAVSDEITFENQIKAPEDPFVGTAYSSFAALREFFAVHGYKDRASRRFHAHFNVTDSNQTFTGDSIGLAVAALTFAGLMKAEIRRHERLVSQEVAFTGGVDEAGNITPVSEDTLRQKIVRAFFSHIRYLVLPGENLHAASEILEELTGGYPNRTLHLVAYERLADVLGDKNVIRSEKVCIGEFVARKTVYYTRVTRMQVPIFLVLAYLLLRLLHFTYSWITFDDNPQYVHPTGEGFMALNADSTALWEKEYACDTLHCQRWIVEDLDNDGKNEVAVLPQSNAACSCSSMLYVYNYQGNLLFARDAVILNEYPGDSTRNQTYNSQELKIVQYADETVILTSLTGSGPARTLIKFWSVSGELNGWYVDAGGCARAWQKMNANGKCEMLLFCGINNPEESACIFVLPRDSAHGVAPPLTYPEYDMAEVKRGNQLKYVIFPRSDYCMALHNQYNGISAIKLSSSGLFEVLVEENVDGDEPLTYYVNADLRVVKVERRDPFMRARERLVDEGKLPPMLDTADYFAKLRDSVKYWTDSGWVTEAQLRAAETSH